MDRNDLFLAFALFQKPLEEMVPSRGRRSQYAPWTSAIFFRETIFFVNVSAANDWGFAAKHVRVQVQPFIPRSLMGLFF